MTTTWGSPDPNSGYTQSQYHPQYPQSQYRQSHVSQYPQSHYHNSPRSSASSKCATGLFVNVEFGVSFSENKPPHGVSLKYATKNMKDRMARQQQQQQQQHPQLLMPRTRPQYEATPRHSNYSQYQPFVSQRLSDTRQERERGSSAPPALTDRSQPLSPISPISPISPPISPLQHHSSMPIERIDRPLPPTPAQFRLGDADLPWSTPPSYWNAEPTPPETTPTERENRRLEDPQRVRDLSELQQAMMTVDSLSDEGWETWTWDSVGANPRGPRSIGWAVRSEEPEPTPATAVVSPRPASGVVSPGIIPPPPYVVSQWEQAFERQSRPRTAV